MNIQCGIRNIQNRALNGQCSIRNIPNKALNILTTRLLI